MSYLDVPRIHFGGLFFTNPDTTNNIIQNYNPKVPLTNPQGSYLPNAGWNAVGVAQLWLAECSVLSVVGPAGTLMTDAAQDPIVGAAVETPSPSTPKPRPDGLGSYDIAKMVDLDPGMQVRSAVYGLRIYVTLPDGAGFSGLVSVPELQFMAQRTALSAGSWSAVGTWMGQIADVAWSEGGGSSTFLPQFQAACGQGIAVKLTVDLHQNNPQTKQTPGNLFCYGRVHGCLGPVRGGELAQVVPGRQIVQPPAPPAPSSDLLAAQPASKAPAPRRVDVSRFVGRTIDDHFRAKAAAGAAAPQPQVMAAAAPPPAPWNTALAQVSTGDQPLLHIDLGSSIWVDSSQDANGIAVSDGTYVVDSGIVVGVATAAGGFQPLAGGQVSFAGQYHLLTSQNKTVNLVASAGMVDIPLAADEVALVAGQPLVIQLAGSAMLQEPADGLLLGSQPLSLRLQPEGTATVQLMARRFGAPVVGEQPVTWQVADGDGNPSTEIVLAWASATDADGLASLTVSTPAGDVALPALRVPLDSQLYIVTLLDASGQSIGDATGYNLSLVRFQSYTAPAVPTWDADAGPVLQAYARLYPGMSARLDIGDEATVQSAAPLLYGRMSLPILDPAYMPVTRDLSPAKIAMILAYLKPFLAPPANPKPPASPKPPAAPKPPTAPKP